MLSGCLPTDVWWRGDGIILKGDRKVGLVSNVLPFQDLGTGLTGRKPRRSGCRATLPPGTPPSTERERAPSPTGFLRKGFASQAQKWWNFLGCSEDQQMEWVVLSKPKIEWGECALSIYFEIYVYIYIFPQFGERNTKNQGRRWKREEIFQWNTADWQKVKLLLWWHKKL